MATENAQQQQQQQASNQDQSDWRGWQNQWQGWQWQPTWQNQWSGASRTDYQATDPWQETWGRRSSLDSASTSAGGGEQTKQPDAATSGKWWETPLGWTWGESLDQAIEWAIERKWFSPTKEFCKWWSEQNTAVKADSVSVTASEEGNSTSSTTTSKKNSGKELVPEYDGASSMREYQRRVRLFESTTSIDKCFQAGRLVERMSGQAWKATETLDIASLKCDEGVQILLDHMWAELEPLEFVRVFKTLHGFYEQFKRQRGQDVIAYDSAFRAQVKLLEEVGAGIEGLTKGYWFLAKAEISEDMRQKIVSASGGSYEYEKLRDALAAISPTVSRSDGQTEREAGQSRLWKGRRFDHRVNMVGDFGDDDSENEALAIEAEAQDEMAMAEAMEQEASVLMTQAAKRRSMVERARGFQKAESTEERAKRISAMKQRMPCNACRQNSVWALALGQGVPLL